MESVTLSVFGQELFIALSDDNWTTKNENEEAYLACPKTGIIDTNIKMVLNTVMEQDSENPTPKLDKEPYLRAEKVGFEPTCPGGLTHFECAPL